MAKVKSVRALERGLQVLEQVRESDAVTLKDLHRHTRLSRATLLRALKTLEQRGWVQIGADGVYRPGAAMFADGTTSSRRHQTLAGLVLPILNELGRKVVWPSDVGVCRGRSMVILESSRRNSPFVINRNAIGRRPSMLKSAMGRAYLAYCPAAERERLFDRLRRSTHPDDKIVNMPSVVSRVLRDTRVRGYGVREPGYWAAADDYGGEVSSIAVPVMVGESVVACISLLWVAGASTVDDFAAVNLAPLREAAARLAKRIEEQRGRAR
jgi:IclR family mhp operon transcriptional activator